MRSYCPDVVLLDIGMPGMDGFEVAKQIHRQAIHCNTRLIAVTGYGQEEDRRRASEAGFAHHLTKPIAPEDLALLLKS